MVNKTAAVKCTCNKCGMEEVSISGTKHRNCPGEPEKLRRERNNRLANKERGTWE